MDAADPVVERMAEAATAWLDSLDAGQRAVAHWSFPSDEERSLWFYTPTDHGGLTLRDMDPTQQQGAHRLLASGLSEAGYVTVATVMGLENVLDRSDWWRGPFPGRVRTRDPELYFVRVFGVPGSSAWSWRFGGHHVSVNVLVVNGQIGAATPCFLGADPAKAPLLGAHWLRPLGATEDLGRELVRSLDQSQLARALISAAAPIDIVGANRPFVSPGDGPRGLDETWRGVLAEPMRTRLAEVTVMEERAAGFGAEHREAVRLSAEPRGISARDLRADQREVLRALLDTYLGRLPDKVAERESAKYAADALGSLHFAWAGSQEPGEPHYYRVEGARLLAEYDNTQRNVNHVHTVWRDPVNDFGRDVLAEHYRHGHAHG
jgi:hypothetical protein